MIIRRFHLVSKSFQEKSKSWLNGSVVSSIFSELVHTFFLMFRNLYYPKLIAEGKLKAGPLTVLQGFEKINEGLQDLKEGKVGHSSL
jgi:hypothetical protein